MKKILWLFVSAFPLFANDDYEDQSIEANDSEIESQVDSAETEVDQMINQAQSENPYTYPDDTTSQPRDPTTEDSY